MLRLVAGWSFNSNPHTHERRSAQRCRALFVYFSKLTKQNKCSKINTREPSQKSYAHFVDNCQNLVYYLRKLWRFLW